MHGNTLIIDAFWVDNKPFPTAMCPNSGDGRAFSDYYCGDARYLGWMDLVLLKDIIEKHHINHIILQNLDTLGKIAKVTKEIKICVAYEYKHYLVRSLNHNKIIPLASREIDLMHCKPIYQSVEFGGWELSENDEEIPYRSQYYIRHLLIHTRVNSMTYMNNKVKLTARFDIIGNVVFDTESVT